MKSIDLHTPQRTFKLESHYGKDVNDYNTITLS